MNFGYCDCCYHAAMAMVWAPTDRRPGVHTEYLVCNDHIGDAVRMLEADPHTTGFAQIERYAA